MILRSFRIRTALVVWRHIESRFQTSERFGESTIQTEQNPRNTKKTLQDLWPQNNPGVSFFKKETSLYSTAYSYRYAPFRSGIFQNIFCPKKPTQKKDGKTTESSGAIFCVGAITLVIATLQKSHSQMNKNPTPSGMFV